MPRLPRSRVPRVGNRRRLAMEPLESRHLCAVSRLHNPTLHEDVNNDGHVAAIDAVLVVADLSLHGSHPVGGSGSEGESTPDSPLLLDVNNDNHVSPIDVLLVVTALAPVPVSSTEPVIESSEVAQLLARAAAASRSEDAIIAIVDRGGTILGVRAEADVLREYRVGMGTERTTDFVFAVDGAVAKARTGAFFANGNGQGNGLAPLTSRTVRFVSQSTITQREVESNPDITDPNSPRRGPGFVAPIGLGGHFPPGVANTPPVDLFGIEHTNRDSLVHAGADGIKGTPDDLALASRFNVSPAYIPSGQELAVPESYGVQSDRLPTAQSRGIATLPGGIPLYKKDSRGQFVLVGGIGVFFPGPDGFATFEQGFVPGVGQTELDRTNAPKVLEAEWIAFAAAGGSAIAGASVGALGGVPPVAGYDLPAGRIDLVGITLEVFGPHPTQFRPQPGIVTLLQTGAALGIGSPTSGTDQPVAIGMLHMQGRPVPSGWLVAPHGSADLSAAEVERIINQGIAEASLVRAAIRLNETTLKAGPRTRMVFAVADKNGELLGLYRMPDATVFSLDVAVAKARNTAYHADPTALLATDRVDDNGDGVADGSVPAGVAMTNRTFRFLAQPRFPTGLEKSRSGAFSSLLDVGIHPATGENLGPALPASTYDSSDTGVLLFDAFHAGRNFRDPDRIANQNGIVFFPGSTPLYRGSFLAGGFGVSGDGVDQDDVVTASGAVGFAAPEALRADQYFVRGVRLPFQKFLRNPRG